MMKRVSGIVCAIVLMSASSFAAAQSSSAAVVAPVVSPVQRIASHQAWEYGALAQGGVGLTENRDSFRFLMAGAHLGRVLTNNSGHRLWSGQFEYAVEFFPYWQSFSPKFQRANCSANPGPGLTFVSLGLYCSNTFTTGGTYTGTTITPIILRWNFTHGRRFMPWAQAAGGLLWTNHKYPSFGSPQLSLSQDGPATETSVFNFTPQGGVGFHYFLNDRHSIDFSANGVHISSASLGDKNPGINASVQFSLGYTWWK
jgi:lipid A 3-O-deacylase